MAKVRAAKKARQNRIDGTPIPPLCSVVPLAFAVNPEQSPGQLLHVTMPGSESDIPFVAMPPVADAIHRSVQVLLREDGEIRQAVAAVPNPHGSRCVALVIQQAVRAPKGWASYEVVARNLLLRVLQKPQGRAPYGVAGVYLLGKVQDTALVTGALTESPQHARALWTRVLSRESAAAAADKEGVSASDWEVEAENRLQGDALAATPGVAGHHQVQSREDRPGQGAVEAVRDIKEEVERIVTQARSIDALLPSEYGTRREWLRRLDVGIRNMIARSLGPALNEHLAAAAQSTYDEKRALARWVNGELRSLGLAIQCPKTGLPAFLVGHPGGAPGVGRFHIEVVESGQVRRTVTSTSLPVLALMAEPVMDRPNPRAQPRTR